MQTTPSLRSTITRIPLILEVGTVQTPLTTDKVAYLGTGMTIENQIFGVANASNQTALGIMGIGPSSLDGFNKSKPYGLILDSLATQGHINSRAFSLDLRDYDNSTGTPRFQGL